MTKEQDTRFWNHCVEYAEDNIGPDMSYEDLSSIIELDIDEKKFESLRNEHPKEFKEFIDKAIADFAEMTYSNPYFEDLFLEDEAELAHGRD